MGTYTEFKIGGYEVHSSKSSVFDEVMTIFRESDRKDHIDDLREESYNAYVVSAAIASHRLDVMGYTLDKCRKEFESNRKDEIKRLLDSVDEPDDENGS